jgi:hypothetical protein
MLNEAPHCVKPFPSKKVSNIPKNPGIRGGNSSHASLDYAWPPAKIELVRYGEGVPPLTAVLPCNTGMADDS